MKLNSFIFLTCHLYDKIRQNFLRWPIKDLVSSVRHSSYPYGPLNNVTCFFQVNFTKTFKIERITIFIFPFCIGLATQLNDPALGVLKHHYITKRIRELLIGNSRFLIYNLLSQLYFIIRYKRKLPFRDWINLRPK